MTFTYKCIQLNATDDVWRLVINRPEKFNALNAQVLEEINDVLDQLESRRSVRALIITGAGEKAFCAGADLNELETMDFFDALQFLRRGQKVFQRISDLWIPAIAAINGYALGGGFELAMACHLRIATESAQFSLPEAGLGLIPGFGGTQRLSRLIGATRATELMLTGARISADEGHRLGLLNRVCAYSELNSTLGTLVSEIQKRSPISTQLILNAINTGSDIPVERALRLEALAGAVATSSYDKQVGITAFLNKEVPKFTGWNK